MARKPDPYRLVSRLSCLPLPQGPEQLITGPSSLLKMLVMHSDNRGRYYAAIFLLKRLFWWQDVSNDTVEQWRDELVDRGEISIDPLGKSVYGGHAVDIISIIRRQRFKRFKPRNSIPPELREAVYERDGHICLMCGTDENLSLDHILPWSRGGQDTFENLQTLCRPCNSKKHARTPDEYARQAA